MPESKTYPFVAELARNQGLVDNLLDAHVADENGKCKGCYLDDKMRKLWPCSLWHFADRAHHLVRHRQTG